MPTPLTKLTPIKCLAWIPNGTYIRCIKTHQSDGGSTFVAGNFYRLSSEKSAYCYYQTRPRYRNGKQDMERVKVTGTDTIFHLRMAGGAYLDRYAREHARFCDCMPISVLCENFDIPDVPDVSMTMPDVYNENLALLDTIERITPLQHLPFQRADLAAAACVDGVILSWEQGLGKTIAAFSWPFLKRAARTLLVAPSGLHLQIQQDAQRLYHIHIPIIATEADLKRHRLNTPIPAALDDSMGKYYLISYEDLTRNNSDEAVCDKKKRRLAHQLIARNFAIAALTNTKLDLSEYFSGIGNSRRDITCVWAPSLARLLTHYQSLNWGFDCVVLDEATRLQGDSVMSNAIRLMSPRYRLLLTGTPIKNRLGSAFNLAWWASGGHTRPTAIFPYDISSQSYFSNSHLEIDRFMTREEEKEAREFVKTRITRPSARVCNVHSLWKIFAPLIIRRRKSECGENIVMKIVKPLYVPLSEAQAAVYKHHLHFPPVSAAGTNKPISPLASLGSQLTNLRLASCCPDAPSLANVVNNSVSRDKCSWTPWTPKLAATITLISDLLSVGEQVVVGSPFSHFSNTLETFLASAGVNVVTLDGNTPPEMRSLTVERFKNNGFSVLICGLQSMSEGFNLDNCAHLILPGKAWSYDINSQFEARIWRLTSKRTVHVYPVISSNTIDERMAVLYADKTDSSDISLDGSFFDQETVEIDCAKLLYDSIKLFNTAQHYEKELALEAEWPQRQAILKQAQRIYDEFHPPIINGSVTAAEQSAAVKNLTLSITPSVAKQRLLNKLKNLLDDGSNTP